MYRPPPEDRARLVPEEPSWQRVVESYALVAAFFLVLWAVSNPLVGTVVIITLAGASLVAPRAIGLVRCLSRCREITVQLGRRFRITIVRGPVDAS